MFSGLLLAVCTILTLLECTAASMTNVTIPLQIPIWSAATEELYQVYRLAIEEINAHPEQWNGLHIEHVSREDANSDCNQALATKNFFSFMETYGENFVGLVGAGCSVVSRVLGIMGAVFEIPQISPSSTSSTLSNKLAYPYFSRVIPEDSFQGRVLVETTKSLGYDRVALVYSNNVYGASGSQEFMIHAERLNITVLGVQSIGDAEDHEQIDRALHAVSDQTYVVVAILSGTQVGESLIKRILATNLHFQLLLLSEGAAALNPDPGVKGRLNVVTTAPSITTQGARYFTPRFLNRSIKHNVTSYNSTYCAICQCDGTCADEEWIINGTRYSKSTQEPTFHLYSPFVYDATLSFALAINKSLSLGMNVSDGAALIGNLGDLKFQGASGSVSFDGNLDRLGSYEVRHYHSGQGRWDAVGLADYSTGTFQFDESQIAWETGRKPLRRFPAPPVRCTPEHVRVVDLSPPCSLENTRAVHFEWDPAQRCTAGELPGNTTVPCSTVQLQSTPWRVAFGLAVGNACFCMAFLGYILTHRRQRGVRFLQPLLISIFLVGVTALPFARFIVATQLSDTRCMSLEWFTHLTLSLAVSSLCARLYRVHRVICSRKYSVVLVTNAEVVRLVSLFCGVVASTLTVWQVLSPKTVEEIATPYFVEHEFVVHENENETNMTTRKVLFEILSIRCSDNGKDYEAIIFFAESMLLLYGCYLAFTLRKAPSELTGGNNFGFAMYNIALCFLANNVFQSMQIGDPVGELYTDVFSGVALASVSSLILIVPVLIKIHNGDDFNIMSSKKLVIPGSAVVPRNSTKQMLAESQETWQAVAP